MESSPEPSVEEAVAARLQALERRLLELEDAHYWRASTPLLARISRSLRQRLVTWIGPPLGVPRQHAPRPAFVPRHYGRVTVPQDPPLITITTPALNAERFLERTIRSVVEQGYPRLEYRVRDGGSTDATADILARFPGLDWDSRPDTGQAAAINRAFASTNGTLMAWLNADDVLLPGSLAYVAGYFAHHPEIDVLYGHRVLLDEEDREIGRWVMPPHSDEALSWGNYVPQEAMFWRRSLWERIGAALDESFQFAMDWDLLLRFRVVGARFAVVPRFLAGFRVHAQQKSATQMTTVGFAECTRLRERVHGRHVTRGEIERALEPYLNRSAVRMRLYRLGLLRY